jgi:collagenase-like PrtC family protease
MMNILIGINNLKEAMEFKNDIQEFYFGLGEISNHRKWYKNLNLNSMNEAREIIKFANSFNKKIYLAVNEIYEEKEFNSLLKIVKDLLENGLGGLIVRDIRLLNIFKGKTFLILSTTATTFNSQSVNFYKQLGAERITLPCHLMPSEAKEIITANNNKIDFEIFYFPHEFCRNIDGICLYHTFRSNITAGNCKYPLVAKEKRFIMPLPDITSRENFIKEYKKLGIKYLKIPRDGEIKEKKEIIKKIKNLTR